MRFIDRFLDPSRCLLYGVWLPSDLRSGRARVARRRRRACDAAAGRLTRAAAGCAAGTHASRRDQACTGAESWSGNYVYCNNW